MESIKDRAREQSPSLEEPGIQYTNRSLMYHYGTSHYKADHRNTTGYVFPGVSLGYRIPLKLFRRNTQLKLSVFASNILLFSKYKGVDLETNLTGSSNGFGLDYFYIPGSKSIGMSLNWEF